MGKSVNFNERVTVASLPVEELRDAWHARRGTWASAPVSDELWDGDRRVFWEKELSSEELREIIRFRRLAKYASALQNLPFGLKVPMPKPPPIIEDLMKDPNKLKEGSSPRSNPRSSLQLHVSPMDQEEYSSSSSTSNNSESPKNRLQVIATVDNMFIAANNNEPFEFTNPSLLVSSNNPSSSPALGDERKSPSASLEDSRKRLSASQLASMQNAGKVLRLDSPRLGHAVHHRQQSKRARAQKRRNAHAILQPWFVMLYFFIPLCLLASRYFIPFWRNVYYAWRENRAIQAAIEIPWFIERLLNLPDVPILQSTVYVGLFAVEMTTIVYLVLLVSSQLTIFLIMRPLILSLSSSFSERGAARDSFD